MGKKFFLFAGDKYHPKGGWQDFKDRYETREQALEAAVKLKADWVQIVNIETHQIVYESEQF